MLWREERTSVPLLLSGPTIGLTFSTHPAEYLRLCWCLLQYSLQCCTASEEDGSEIDSQYNLFIFIKIIPLRYIIAYNQLDISVGGVTVRRPVPVPFPVL